MTVLDLTSDELLSTTRMVRLRLDLTRPVSHELLRECVDLAVQAPIVTNRQRRHFVVVTDAERERALADVGRAGMNGQIDAAETALTDRAGHLLDRRQPAPRTGGGRGPRRTPR